MKSKKKHAYIIAYINFYIYIYIYIYMHIIFFADIACNITLARDLQLYTTCRNLLYTWKHHTIIVRVPPLVSYLKPVHTVSKTLRTVTNVTVPSVTNAFFSICCRAVALRTNV